MIVLVISFLVMVMLFNSSLNLALVMVVVP